MAQTAVTLDHGTGKKATDNYPAPECTAESVDYGYSGVAMLRVDLGRAVNFDFMPKPVPLLRATWERVPSPWLLLQALGWLRTPLTRTRQAREPHRWMVACTAPSM
jgi:hypothetical protein